MKELKTIEAEWKIYEAQCLHPDSPPIQRQCMREAFFAGSIALFAQVKLIGEPVTPADVAERHLTLLEQEIMDYGRDYIRDRADRVN